MTRQPNAAIMQFAAAEWAVTALAVSRSNSAAVFVQLVNQPTRSGRRTFLSFVDALSPLRLADTGN